MDDPPRNSNFELGDAFAEVLTETTQSLVCVLDRDGRIMLFNDACERTTGFTRNEVLGRPLFESVIPREEADAFREVLAFIWRTGHSSPQVGHWQTKDGGRRLIAWSNKPVKGADGVPAYLVTSGIDLTDRVEGAESREPAMDGDPGRSWPRSDGSLRNSGHSAGWRRSSLPRRARSASSWPCRPNAPACSR